MQKNFKYKLQILFVIHLLLMAITGLKINFPLNTNKTVTRIITTKQTFRNTLPTTTLSSIISYYKHKNHNGLSKYTFFDPFIDLTNSLNYNNNNKDDFNNIENNYHNSNSLFSTNSYSQKQCGTRTISYEQQQNQKQNRNGRIIGGFEAPYGAFPWQVEIQLFNLNRKRFEHYCNGALIHEKIVITAAHCLQIPQLEYLRLVFGDHYLAETDLFEHGFRVDAILTHPEYRKKGIYSNDIGLLRIKTPHHAIGIPFNTHIRSICLPNKNDIPAPGTWCYVSGWGAYQTDDLKKIAGALRAASIPIVDWNSCRKHFANSKKKYEILDTMLCAGFLQGGIDACSGDSGGPLACEINKRFVLTGIVSWGDGCAKRNRPGIYTRVDSYIDWITHAITKLLEKN